MHTIYFFFFTCVGVLTISLPGTLISTVTFLLRSHVVYLQTFAFACTLKLCCVCQKVTSHPLFTVHLMNDEIVFFFLVFFNVKLKVAHY